VKSGALAMLRLRRGQPGLVPTPEEAEAYPYSAMEEDFVASWLSNVVHGDPETVRAGLDALAERTAADELMITANFHGGAARLRSYELIARAYKLG
jgi:alkanesulfonate monooxygenase SsuD/methylene tetrahydromethanopterin reductase-like flavin-dependent oxidoreductase (luciferase family)